MKAKFLVQLAADGDVHTVSEEWMRVFETSDGPIAGLTRYRDVLEALGRAGAASQAEELAWSAIEMLGSRHPASDVLVVAGALLSAVEASEEVRRQVAELYRSAYVDREGIGALLDESGLAGGRPVRRALRTLDVCLALHEGDFLAARDDDGAARVDSIDASSWRFGIETRRGAETLDAVRLADHYGPAPPTHFAVMRQFAPDQWLERLWSDPADVVIDLCRRQRGKIGSDRLEAILARELPSEADWKKWWARARTALRKCPHIRISGRSPHEIEYDETPAPLDEDMLGTFGHVYDPLAKLDLVEKYLRESKLRREPPSDHALRRCLDQLVDTARGLTADTMDQAATWWLVARKVAESAGLEPPAEAVEFFRAAPNVEVVFHSLKHPALLELACTCLVEARPNEWPDRLMRLLPTLPAPVCDPVAGRLVSIGRGATDFEPLVERIMASPVDHFEALLWLWDGPPQGEVIPIPPPMTILSRILRAVEDSRRDDAVSREATRTLAGRARAVLSARQYERFERCVEGLDPGMASALRTQLRRTHGLGPAVQTDLINRLDRRCPPVRTVATVELWALSDVLLVTEAGLARKQAEIEHHVNVKMKENAEAIGRAAAYGDLSENSEYKFALEERDLLRARLAQMNTEVATARIMTPRDVPTDRVGIGTRVTLRREGDGVPYEMTFVGPWEADPSKNWFNYKAPLGLKVLGKRIGEIVEFEHTGAVGTYRIITLANGLGFGE